MQSVEVLLAAKLGEDGLDERFVAAGALAHLARQCDGARIAVLRDRGVPVAQILRSSEVVTYVGRRFQVERGQHGDLLLTRKQLEVAGAERSFASPARHHVERENPVAVPAAPA